MGGFPCHAKQILNGRTIINETTELLKMLDDASMDDDYGYKIVDYLNAAEDAVFGAKRMFLESQGFKGPFPKSLA